MKAKLLDKNMYFYLTAAFLNAFVDLAHKITIQNIIFKTMDGTELLIMTQIVNALILLPFVLFFIPAGEMNDNRNKLTNMKLLALIAVFLCAMITVFFLLGLFWPAFLATLLLGTQAAFYSPAKYGYAKELSKSENLAKTNSALQSVSIVSIILSTLVFSIIFDILTTNLTGSKEEYLQKLFPIGFIITVLSIMEYISLLAINKQKNSKITDKIPSLKKYSTIIKDKSVFVSIILLSIFFALSQSVMASFPSFAKEDLGITSALSVQAAMALSAVGVIVGSVISGNYKNSRHRIAFVFFGMLAYSLFLVLVLTGEIHVTFFCIGIAAGFIIVPLNTLIQEKIESQFLGSAISLSNLAQNILMLLFLALGIVAALSGFEARNILLICSIFAIFGAFYASFYFPQPIIEAVLALLFSFRYKFTVHGHKPHNLGGKILIGNHTSYIDWAFLQMAMDEKIYFLMEKEIYEKSYLRPFLSFFGALPIDSANAKDSIKKAIKLLEEGRTIVIFPEGELTKDGNIGEFKKGFELISKRSGAPIFVFYLDGLFGSRFSKSVSKAYITRKVSLVFGEKLEDKSSAAAQKAVTELRKIMI